ncbi:MAG: YkgJ family cysteine cluster protein [Candidatus Sericytochromatia bacterium]|nr:YkgJ family cysteine cluster protein [Candidatus Sericytochromatia bacterium]
MFLKKENELNFACQSCGNCCRTFSINLTHLDVERILENRPDLTPDYFVDFSAETEKDDPEGFIATYGKRQMVLKKKLNSEECVFLENNICSIHDFKPRVCKVWPFSLEKNDHITWIKEHRSFIKKRCSHISVAGANDPEQLTSLIKQHYREQKLFIKLVSKWNNDKKNELKDGELFSDILDEHFFDYISKEIKVSPKKSILEQEVILDLATPEINIETKLNLIEKKDKINLETRIELNKIYTVFYENVIKIIDYINVNDFVDAKILMNLIFNQYFCAMLYWLNQDNFSLSNTNNLKNKTDDLEYFLIEFGNYKTRDSQIIHLKDIVDIFERTWVLSGLDLDEKISLLLHNLK